jgi:hypothetical protein
MKEAGEIEGKKMGRCEGEGQGLRLFEERFRLRSSSYAPTSRLRLEVGGKR